MKLLLGNFKIMIYKERKLCQNEHTCTISEELKHLCILPSILILSFTHMLAYFKCLKRNQILYNYIFSSLLDGKLSDDENKY